MGSREDDLYFNAKYEACDCAQCRGEDACSYCGGAIDEDGNCEECDG